MDSDLRAVKSLEHSVSKADTAVDAVVLATLIILESSGETYRAEDTAYAWPAP